MPKISAEARVSRRLRFRDLHVFLAVVECGSMGKAAVQLGTTQPSVSMVENLLLSSFTALCVGFIAYALLTGYDQIKLRSRQSSEADYEMSDPWS